MSTHSLGLLRGSVLTLALSLAAGCGQDPAPAQTSEHAQSPPEGQPEVRGEAVVSQTVYVPVYSHIFFQDEVREIDLAATLSVRNTDPDNTITVTDIRYHDSTGQLVRRYAEGALALPPLASRAYVVEERDRTGGVGANFLVEWEAAVEVSPPVIEAVMISTAQSQGISFVSPGRVVRPLDEANRDETDLP